MLRGRHRPFARIDQMSAHAELLLHLINYHIMSTTTGFTGRVSQKDLGTIITVEVRNVWGNDLIYITSPHGQYIQRLTGRKTITHTDIHHLQVLGFTFVNAIGLAI